MTWSRTTPALALLVALTGCTGSPPTADEQRSADYGLPPVDWSGRVQSDARARYRDLNLVQVTTEQPRRAWFGDLGGLFQSRDVRYGWSVRFSGFRLGFVQMDSKVIEGEYFFRDDELIAIFDTTHGMRWLRAR